MSYIQTCCVNQTRKSGKDTKDDLGYPYIYCKITGQMCVAQRWCPEQKKHVISERAKKICKHYQ